EAGISRLGHFACADGRGHGGSMGVVCLADRACVWAFVHTGCGNTDYGTYSPLYGSDAIAGGLLGGGLSEYSERVAGAGGYRPGPCLLRAGVRTACEALRGPARLEP